MDRTGLQSGLHHGLVSGLNPLRKQSVSIPMEYLKLWLKASAGITKDGSNYISRWADLSGNGYDAVQNTGNLQPLFIENDPLGNNKPSVYFNADYLLGSIIPGINTSSMSVFVAMRSDNVATDDVLFSINDPYYWIDKDQYGRIQVMNNINSVYSTDNGIFPNPLKYKVLSTVKEINVNHKCFVNGIEKISNSTAGFTGNFTNGTYRIGNRSISGDRPYKGYISEILLYGTNLQTSNKQIVENYLINEYAA